MKFKDKVVIITWASKWIWRTTALFFWKERAIVVVNYLSSENEANKVVNNIEKLWWKSIAIKCDISDENNVKDMVNQTIKHFWKIDILINNAWIYKDATIFERSVEQWNKTISINLLWTFLCSKYVVKEMLKNNNWRIVNLSSVNWTKFFSPDQIDYDVSKAWIIALTKNFAKAFAPNIIVNAIAPWNVATEISMEHSKDSYEDDVKPIYLKRFATTSEIAKLILFLSSDDSSYINGSVLYADWWFDWV